MDKLTDNTYIKPNATKQWLLSHGFRYNRLQSDEESGVYSYRFPVHKYKKYTTLEGELCIILGENTVTINVYKYKTFDRYVPFYYCEYGYHDKLLNDIWSNIEKEIKKLGIIKN